MKKDVSKKSIIALQEYSVSDSFSNEELSALASVLSRRRYQAGDALIVENSPADKIFFLKKGALEISKTVEGKLYSLGYLDTKKAFGELAHLTEQKRSCTITALENVEVLVASKADFSQLAPHFSYLQDKLSLHMAIDGLRDNYHKMTHEIILRNKFGKFVLALILSFCLFIFFLQFYQQLLSYTSSYTIGAVVLTSGTLLCLYTINILQQPFRSFGVTQKNWQRSLAEGLLICAVLVVIAYLFFPDIDLVQGILHDPNYIILYLFISFVQEFIFRGITLPAFEQFYNSTGYAVLLTSFLFGILHLHLHLHLHLGLPVFFFSFLTGFFLGILYVRHRNLLGITLVHACLGILASSIIGIMYL
ncbi:MAG: CPBP family intramembrane metalloprotease [Candidatus Electrothrix sp. AR3]|nr:CPBP family intramembrane metalloprotease [Candidatus Electrothrix sp. AR3]